MKAHQRIIRERKAQESGSDNLFGAWWNGINTSLSNAKIKRIEYATAEAIITEYEWLGTMPQAVTMCFGLFFDGCCAGALVFAEKPGSNLASNEASIVPADSLYLARGACVHWSHEHSASFFIAAVARRFLGNCTILAYSDHMAGEIGTIYQALNWIYLGASKGGPHGFMVDGKLIPIRSFNRDRNYRVGQSLADVQAQFPGREVVPVGRKGRYVGVYGDRKWKKQMMERLMPSALPYPKRNASEVSRVIRPALQQERGGDDSTTTLHLSTPGACR